MANERNLIAGVDDNDEIKPIQVESGKLKVITVNDIIPNIEDVAIIIQTPVTSTDTSTDSSNYVAGSEGLIKTIKTYPSNAQNGDPALIITNKYENATYPHLITRSTPSIGTV